MGRNWQKFYQRSEYDLLSKDVGFCRRMFGYRFSFVAGSFDHITDKFCDLIDFSLQATDGLIVGLYEDDIASLWRSKPGYKIPSLDSRAKVISMMEGVSFVVETKDLNSVVQAVRPDVFIVGGDMFGEVEKTLPVQSLDSIGSVIEFWPEGC